MKLNTGPPAHCPITKFAFWCQTGQAQMPVKEDPACPVCVNCLYYLFILISHGVIFNIGSSQVLSVLADYYYYGKWTSSVLNLLVYNVLAGGESHLYGIEGPLFYLRNGFNNFNCCFILALLFLGILPFEKKKYAPDLLIIVSPIYIWLAFMSLQPHKEERWIHPSSPSP